MKYDNPLAQKATFHEVVTWEYFYEKDCHLLPLPICLPHADASEDDKRGAKRNGKQKGREKTLDYAFKVILGLGKWQGFESEFGDNVKFAPDAC